MNVGHEDERRRSEEENSEIGLRAVQVQLISAVLLRSPLMQPTSKSWQRTEAGMERGEADRFCKTEERRERGRCSAYI
jgi:hypothetical protein